MENITKPIEPTTNAAVARAASKNQKALDELVAAEARHRAAFKKRCADLARAAATDAANRRRAERDGRRKQEAQMASRLGRMVLEAMRRQGLTGTLLIAADLNGWLQRDRDELQVLLAPPPAELATSKAARRAAGESNAPLDVDLGA